MSPTVIVSIALIVFLVIMLGIIRLRYVSLQDLVLNFVGSIIGLTFGSLASVPLSKLPQPYGGWLPIVVSAVAVIAGIVAVYYQRQSFLRLLPWLSLKTEIGPVEEVVGSASAQEILVDTSVIIDGRIADIAKAGFVPGHLLVPRFVLAELQNIADSDDAMRRGRGRRGLEVLNSLRSTDGIEVEIVEDELAEIKEVDAKLVRLARDRGANVLTTDFNLNRVASIEGVRVLNINELSNAIRPVVLPGEDLAVQVVQMGKEKNQGVGYLPDGTMIVVENGDKLIGQEVMTEVTRVFQTVAGKMIFAAPRKADIKFSHRDPKSTAKPASSADQTQKLEQAPIIAPMTELGIPTAELIDATVTPTGSPKGRRGYRGGRRVNGSGSKSVEDRLVSSNND